MHDRAAHAQSHPSVSTFAVLGRVLTNAPHPMLGARADIARTLSPWDISNDREVWKWLRIDQPASKRAPSSENDWRS